MGDFVIVFDLVFCNILYFVNFFGKLMKYEVNRRILVDSIEREDV